MATTEHELTVERRDRVAILDFGSGTGRTVLSDRLLARIVAALSALDGDRSIGCVVLTGGPDGFAAGADLHELAERSAEDVMVGPREPLWQALRAVRQPLLGAVSGLCLGGGCELALTCDLVVASETAVFGQPELAVGLTPGGGGTQYLVHAAGRAIAADMVLAGRRLDADEALAHGLVSRVHPLEEWWPAVLEQAAAVAAQPIVAARVAKQALRLANELPLSAGAAFERTGFQLALASPDRAEGIDAFLARRAPRWQGHDDV